MDALYIRFLETSVTTQQVAEGIAGIEILDARQRFGAPEVFRRVILEDIAMNEPATAMPS